MVPKFFRKSISHINTTKFIFPLSDTCHFQKLNDRDESRNEFDFHWNTSPTSVVCAFPYILGFTADSMEIRLLVNGNLVHTAILPELQMLTSKRDIFFVTTAPEFMSKDFNIKGLQINEQTSERRLVTTPSECSSSEELTRDSTELLSMTSGKELPLNPEHEMNNLLEIPSLLSVQGQPIQRARSLQKTSNVDEKPVIAKSNSCGDSYSNEHKYNPLRHSSIVDPQQQPGGVPPNSPRTNSNNNNTNNHNNNHPKTTATQHSPMSPTKRNSKYRNLFSTSNGSGSQTPDNYSSSPDRLKPLRVYRIPLAKLAGAHSHFHMQSFNATAAAKLQQQQQHHQQHFLRDHHTLSSKSRQKSIDIQLPLQTTDIPE